MILIGKTYTEIVHHCIPPAKGDGVLQLMAVRSMTYGLKSTNLGLRLPFSNVDAKLIMKMTKGTLHQKGTTGMGGSHTKKPNSQQISELYSG